MQTPAGEVLPVSLMKSSTQIAGEHEQVCYMYCNTPILCVTFDCWHRDSCKILFWQAVTANTTTPGKAYFGKL